jgi:protein-S-isoprenylcysteine O-methyltransferase Ste14
VKEGLRPGRWIVLVPVGLVVLGITLRQEERLMLATFPVEYPAYRARARASA